MKEDKQDESRSKRLVHHGAKLISVYGNPQERVAEVRESGADRLIGHQQQEQDGHGNIDGQP